MHINEAGPAQPLPDSCTSIDRSWASFAARDCCVGLVLAFGDALLLHAVALACLLAFAFALLAAFPFGEGFATALASNAERLVRAFFLGSAGVLSMSFSFSLVFSSSCCSSADPSADEDSELLPLPLPLLLLSSSCTACAVGNGFA